MTDAYLNYPVGIATDRTNHGLLMTAGILSILGCLFTIITYNAYKDLQTSSRHLMVCISISDFLYITSNVTAANIEDAKKHELVCIIQSFIGSTFVLCSFLWTGSLAVFLYITIVKEKKHLADRLIWPWFHLVCWLVPLAINLVALGLKVLGSGEDYASAGWCWIRVSNIPKDISKQTSIIWMFVDGKGIEIMTYVVVFVCYFLVRRHLRKEVKSTRLSGSTTSQFVQPRTVMAAKSADRKMLFVPICFFLVRIWGTVRFLMYISKSQSPGPSSLIEHVLLHVHSVGDNLQGFVNFLLFCVLTKKVRNRIKDSIRNCCCCEKTTIKEPEEEKLVYDMQ